jgi:two-component sensor histidine kinase
MMMSMNIVSPLRPRPRWGSSREAEADHRIANSFATIGALIRVRARAANDVVDPQIFLWEIADRIDTVAKLHRLFAASDGGSVRLKDYLQEICERLASALASTSTLFSVSCSPEQLVPFKVAMPLGLITAELFSNSLKYAHPTGLPVKISVSCTHTAAGELTMTYQDDGVGFPEGFDVSNDGHLGMRFIRSLSDQVMGTHRWLSDPLGIRFDIAIPLSERG